MSLQSINPATCEVVATWQRMSRDEVMSIVTRTHTAWQAWRGLSVAERLPHFERLATVLRAHRDEWAALITAEMGKPITEARGEVEKCAWLTEVYVAHALDWLADEHVAADGLSHTVTFQPLGVIFSIMPWNYPFWQALRFAIPGLIYGPSLCFQQANHLLTQRRLVFQYQNAHEISSPRSARHAPSLRVHPHRSDPTFGGQ